MADDFQFQIKLDDKIPEVLKALKERTEDCLYLMGTRAVEGAVRSITKGANQAVDTGRLRASISFVTPQKQSGQVTAQTPKAGQTIEGNPLKQGDLLDGKAPKDSVYVGTNVEYAQFVHNGTSRMAGRPFLTDGIQNNKEYIEEGVKGVLEGRY